MTVSEAYYFTKGLASCIVMPMMSLDYRKLPVPIMGTLWSAWLVSSWSILVQHTTIQQDMTDMFLADRAPGHFHSMTRQAWLGGISMSGCLCGLARLYNCDSQHSHASLIAHLSARWHERGTQQVSGFAFLRHTSLFLYMWMFGPTQFLRKVLESYIRIQPTWPCSEATKHHLSVLSGGSGVVRKTRPF